MGKPWFIRTNMKASVRLPFGGHRVVPNAWQGWLVFAAFFVVLMGVGPIALRYLAGQMSFGLAVISVLLIEAVLIGGLVALAIAKSRNAGRN